MSLILIIRCDFCALLKIVAAQMNRATEKKIMRNDRRDLHQWYQKNVCRNCCRSNIYFRCVYTHFLFTCVFRCVCVCWLRFILIFGIHFSCHLVRFHIFCLTCAVILSVFKLDPRWLLKLIDKINKVFHLSSCLQL